MTNKLYNSKENLLIFLPIAFFFTLLTFYVGNNFFFWDTIQLASIPAHFYFENNFSQLFLPTQYDTGHIPSFGMYLALIWKVFGKGLLISHLAELPFVFGIIWQLIVFIKRYISTIKYAVIILILALADSTFLSQAILVTPDIPLIFFFLLGINAILKNKKLLLTIAIIGLFVINMRGLIVSAALLVLDIILTIKFNSFSLAVKQILKKSIFYLPALIILITYQYYHYKATGWVWSHKNSPWIVGHDTNNFTGAIYNIGIFCWRLIDFGRIFIYLLLIFLLLKNRRKILLDKKAIQLFFIVFIIVLFLILPFAYYKYLTGHRYLLPIYLPVTIFTGYLIFNYVKSKKIANILFFVLFIGMVTGNFWIYPPTIAQGWDSSLAHIPYYNLQNKMLKYIKKEKIPLKKIGSEFPSLGEQRYITLNSDRHSFKKKNVFTDKYILYSNIFNDFTDKEYDYLHTHFKLKKEFKSGSIFVQLYKEK